LLEQVFSRFDSFLALQGIHANRGQIIDAMIVPVPI